MDEKLKNALMEIHLECIRHDNCCGCPLWDGDDIMGECGCGKEPPHNWNTLFDLRENLKGAIQGETLSATGIFPDKIEIHGIENLNITINHFINEREEKE